MSEKPQAPGQPGATPRWTTGAKTGVGTALTAASPVWFTLAQGIVSEVYYPGLDQPNIRDLGFVVASEKLNFFSEEKTATHQQIQTTEEGIPAYELVNICREGRYRLTKHILTDPEHSVLIQKVQFKPLQGHLDDYGLYALLAPHVGNQGHSNNGWVGEYGGIQMLFASREGTATCLALACSVPWAAASCGYVGVSDGWQDLQANHRLTQFYTQAPNGNIALTGQIDLKTCGGEFVLTLGFGTSPEEAAQNARAGILGNFDYISQQYCEGWQQYQTNYPNVPAGPAFQPSPEQKSLFRSSLAALRTHEAKSFPGAIVASLSIPFGLARSDHNTGSYHLVWTRDLVEAATGLLAAGDCAAVQRTVFYLMCTQAADGHWPQNMWLNGQPQKTHIQMDQIGLFILLAHILRRDHQFSDFSPWPTVYKAAGFLLRHGPATQQDRWEELGGYSPYTLAVEITALLAAADFAEDLGKTNLAAYLRQTADSWNALIESWTYVTGTDLAKRLGIEGYYIRIAPANPNSGLAEPYGRLNLPNRADKDSQHFPASEMVSPDALALVRFGLRRPDDPRILNTVRAIDALLKTETTSGPVWHRYNQDGYGEHADGTAFDGTGIGRGWPLLAGERGHYELAAGRPEKARQWLEVMVQQASLTGLLPEQIWDAPDIPEKELFNGQATHSARPLAWAHAEYLKLLRSLADGRVFDLPPFVSERYLSGENRDKAQPLSWWRLNYRLASLQAGRQLRIELTGPARIRWSGDNWQTQADVVTTDTGLGLYFADLPEEKLTPGNVLQFTFYWLAEGRWEEHNYCLEITN